MQKKSNFLVPADVPSAQEKNYLKNIAAITHHTGKLMLFACDQKVEHLNEDFYGKGIPAESNDPERLFKIASQGRIGAFATQLGLIARWGKTYNKINYIVKLNSKTNLVKTEQSDPISTALWTVEDVIAFKKNSGLNIRGVGYTVYLGSEFESEMLTQAAQIINKAHQAGLVTILWMYPRGASIKNEHDGALIAGAAGVAHALGSDFAKINPPQPSDNKTSAQWLAIAAQAAGNTKLICSGGKAVDPKLFLQELHEQIHTGNISGNATGRNIHMHSLDTAIAMTEAISAITLDDKDVNKALKLLK